MKPTLPKSKTQISSIYTKLSSIKPTSKASSSTNANSRNSSIPNYVSSKSVKTTQIGSSQASPSKLLNVNNTVRSPVKSPKRIPQLVKPSVINGGSKLSSKNIISFMTKDDSNGNSATSSLSTSSSNSSLNANSTNVSPMRHYVWSSNWFEDRGSQNPKVLQIKRHKLVELIQAQILFTQLCWKNLRNSHEAVKDESLAQF